MQNYRIYYEPGEEEDILNILRGASEVLIDNINATSIEITIESNDADAVYLRILDEVDKQVYIFRPYNRYH